MRTKHIIVLSNLIIFYATGASLTLMSARRNFSYGIFDKLYNATSVYAVITKRGSRYEKLSPSSAYSNIS